MYIELFNDTLKRKHHFLLHYPNLILKLGPLAHISSMRYEAKHREFKQYAHVSCSRINLPHSLANKHQMKLCHRFQTKEGLLLVTEIGPSEKIDLLQYLIGKHISDLPIELERCCS